MKIRTGFVSNSSTTSFLIYGTYFEGALSLTPEGKILLSSITPPGSEEDEEVEDIKWDDDVESDDVNWGEEEQKPKKIPGRKQDKKTEKKVRTLSVEAQPVND